MVANPNDIGPPSTRFVAWMSRADGCPQCVLNVEAPRHVRPAPGGFAAHYRCADCHHEWFTSWTDD